MEYIVLWIFALFGLWSLISNIIDSFYCENMSESFDVVLNVHNRENSIEWIIQKLSNIDMIRVIKVYDNGSTDNTVKIIKELEKKNFKIIFCNEK